MPMKFRIPAKGKIRRPRHENGKMNKEEQRFALWLENEVREGRVIYWDFESLGLRLADRTSYTPDFVVQLADGTIEMVEVKAYWKSKAGPHWEDDARVKWKMAATRHPFRFTAAWFIKGEGWQFEEAKGE